MNSSSVSDPTSSVTHQCSTVGDRLDSSVISFLKGKLKVSKFDLNICFVNVRSLPKHIDEIKFILYNSDIDILGVAETKLHSNVTTPFFAIDGFKMLRHDRPRVMPGVGGGTAIYVRKGLTVKPIIKSSASDILLEYIFIELVLPAHSVAVGVVYNTPPGARISQLEDMFVSLKDSHDSFVVMGDFNINLLGSLTITSNFLSMMSALSLYSPPLMPTRLESLLDFFVLPSHMSAKILAVGQIPVPGIADHDLICLTLNIRRPPPVNEFCEYRDYSRIDTESLLLGALRVPWWNLYNIPDSTEKLAVFNLYIQNLFNDHVPLRRKLIPSPSTPWFNGNILQHMNLRDVAYSSWLRTRSPRDLDRFRACRNRVTNMVKAAKRAYFRRRLNPELPSRNLWRNMRDLGLASSNSVTNDIAPDAINQFFCQTSGSVSNLDEPILSPSLDGSKFSFVCLTELEVFTAVHKIKSNAVGDDGVSIRFLKLLLPCILTPVTLMLNYIITSSSFPALWKRAIVVPVPKISTPSSVTDFRPISLLPALSKVLELNLKSQIEYSLLRNSLLHPLQSGFRPGHSTATALLAVCDDIASSLDRAEFSVLALLDFSRAFDSLNHPRLVSKLSLSYNFHPTAARLINSYLTGRSQYVRIGKTNSSTLDLSQGIGQGTILGPLLFAMYINDVVDVIKYCSFHLYADDLQVIICGPYRNLSLLFDQINSDLASISLWAKHNGLTLNAAKTQCLFIQLTSRVCLKDLPSLLLNGVALSFSENVKNLGVVMNSRLKWSDHAVYICSRVHAALYTLRRLSTYTPASIRLLLVRALIVPIFTYCDTVFCTLDAGSCRRIQVAFNSCIRYIHNLRYYDHVSHLESCVLGVPLMVYYKFRVACFLYKLIVTAKPGYLYQRLNFALSSRSCQLLVPRHRTLSYGRTFFVSAIGVWNRLPVHVKRDSRSRTQFHKNCFTTLQVV